MVKKQPGARIAADTLATLGDRIYGLCGGHIQPIWDAIGDTDTRIVDVRDERSAVHAAHADAEVTGRLGIAMVTAGPGFTNAMTGIANARTSGTPVLIVTGKPPIPQFDRGALQGTPHLKISEPLTVFGRTALEPHRIHDYLVEAAGAALDERGPAVVEIPTDVLRSVADVAVSRPVPHGPCDVTTNAASLDDAASMLMENDRPLAILGRGARDAADEIRELIETGEFPVLTTAGSKGVVDDANEFAVPGARGTAMREADALLLMGKRLDFTLGYGSPAIFGDTTIIQIDIDATELRRNRMPDVAVRGTTVTAANGLLERIDGPIADPNWLAELQTVHREQAERMAEGKRENSEPIHPYRVCGAIERALGEERVVIVDGGDALSFGRVGIKATDPRGYLDPGPLGCLGVGMPFAIGASLARPDADVVCFTGDGSFGFNIADIETAARENIDLTIVVANNCAWNIERYDQLENYGRELGVNLAEIDYADVADGLGATGLTVADVAALDETVATAIDTDGPVVVDVPVDRDAVSPDAANGLAGVPDYQPLKAWDRLERERRGEG